MPGFVNIPSAMVNKAIFPEQPHRRAVPVVEHRIPALLEQENFYGSAFGILQIRNVLFIFLPSIHKEHVTTQQHRPLSHQQNFLFAFLARIKSERSLCTHRYKICLWTPLFTDTFFKQPGFRSVLHRAPHRQHLPASVRISELQWCPETRMETGFYPEVRVGSTRVHHPHCM